MSFKNINELYKFLLNKNLKKEANVLAKISKQVDFGIDEIPFETALSKDTIIPSNISSVQLERCNLVNFGIDTISSKFKDKLKDEHGDMKYFPEEINMVHFDITKLIDCMLINEESKNDLMSLAYSLYQEEGFKRRRIHNVNTFLELFEKYPPVKETFSKSLSRDKINYVLIGTSDSKGRNFIGAEPGAQRFNQLTPRYIIHDLAHSLYDGTKTNRSDFGPIQIMIEYLGKVLLEYNKYIIKYNQNVDKKNSITPQKILGFFKRLLRLEEKGEPAAEKSSEEKKYGIFPDDIGLYNSYGQLNRYLRENSKYYDLRYLVGTTKGGRPKAFTDKSDFDQDFFYYIISSKEGVFDKENDKVLDVFENPKLPPKMIKFFDRFFPNEGYKEDLQNKVNVWHKQAMEEMQDDIDQMTHEGTGYISLLARFYHKDIRGSVFHFNMISGGMAFLEKKIADRLEALGYTERPTGEKYLVQTEKSGKVFDALSGLINENVLNEDGEIGKLSFVGMLGEVTRKEYFQKLSRFGNHNLVNHGDVFFVNNKFIELLKSEKIQKRIGTYFALAKRDPYIIQENVGNNEDYPHKLTVVGEDDALSIFRKDKSKIERIDTEMFFTVIFIKDINQDSIKVSPDFIEPENKFDIEDN